MKRQISEFLNSFLNTFQTIATGFRQVLKFLQFLAKKNRNVYPSIETIAKCTHYSPRTVKRATAYFQQLGWIVKLKRGYQSNLYFMNDEILNIDLDNPNVFKKTPVPRFSGDDPSMAPYYRSNKEYKENHTPKSDGGFTQSEKKIHVPPALAAFLGISDHDKQRLLRHFSMNEIMIGIERAKGWLDKLKSTKQKFQNPVAALWAKCQDVRLGKHIFRQKEAI